MQCVTIRGRSPAEIEELLLAPFEESEFDKSSNRNIEYLPVEAIEARLDDVFGKLGYDRIVSDQTVIEAGNTKSVSLKMTISVYDDNHEVFITKSAFGGADLQLNANGNAVSIKQTVAAAESDAFKHVCATLGIGSCQLREKNQNFGGSGQNLQRYKVTIVSSWRKSSAYIKAEAKLDGVAVEFCIFKDSFEEFAKKCTIDALITKCGPGTSLEFLGVKSSFKGKAQVLFKEHIA